MVGGRGYQGGEGGSGGGGGGAGGGHGGFLAAYTDEQRQRYISADSEGVAEA